MQKVIPYFKQCDVDENQYGEIVKIYIKDTGRVYGDIFCAICKIDGQKNQKAKRVYCNFDGKNNGCWVLSNFVKHLQTVHKMNVHQNRNHKSPESLLNLESNLSIQTNSTHNDSIHTDTSIHIEKQESTGISENDLSVVLVDDEELKTQENKNCDTKELLYDQISKQIMMTMSAVLDHSDRQSQMYFVVGKAPRKLTVATIAGDGNCMFSSLVHQIFLHPINSKKHKDAAKKLRADVVEHILNPKNFPLFLHDLKDRVYDNNNTTDNKISDIEAECKIFVRHVLSKNKTWGGTETLLATSDLYSTNIIIFNEDSTCFKIKRAGKIFERSIAIAYRFGLNDQGERMRNHYDSVCDIGADDIFSAALSMS